MELTAKDTPTTRILRVRADRIDAAAAIAFKESAIEAAKDGPERVLLDLERVQFIDSSGLGAIVAVMKMLAPGRSTELAALSPTVQKVFRLTRMDTVFRIHEDVEDAVAADVA